MTFDDALQIAYPWREGPPNLPAYELVGPCAVCERDVEYDEAFD